ncbi:SMI1/KNR4 family protein [Micromonospora echinofusca]|uniref:SMI1/KNR4 family protein n=2 Tax=Micromonospora echinofusca TaxID=47858 RepID=A0ABS3VWR4_MICEH|nr:SMI1/KNR4 family protein [Micromonospora echinofusca]
MRYRQGVLIDPYGFPDWVLCARAVVELPTPHPELTRSQQRLVDVLAANLVMARSGGDPLWPAVDGSPVVGTPAGWCWAHLGAARRVALVPVELHGSFRHQGGVGRLPERPAPSGAGTVEPACRPVGPAPGHQVPDDLLDLLEQLLGRALPPAYRRFLGATNGAGPAGPAVLPGHGFLADQPFFGLAREDRHQDLSYLADWVADRFTRDFLPVGYVQGGLLAVRTGGDDPDSIWYWDDDDPRDRDGYDAEHICARLLHRVADSVDDLWDRLVAPAPALTDLAGQWVRRGAVRELRDAAVGAGLPPRQRPPWQAAPRSTADPLVGLFEAR